MIDLRIDINGMSTLIFKQIYLAHKCDPVRYDQS